MGSKRRFSRRRFLLAGIAASPLAAYGHARWLEPKWLKVRRLRIGTTEPSHRIVHLTDIHHKGDRPYLAEVVETVNALKPDFVCFTGDLIEEKEHLPEALEILGGIKAPLYGAPGNHDYWSKAPFQPIAETFRKTGGAWLTDRHARTADGKFTIFGASCLSSKQPPLEVTGETRNILLIHYPGWVKKVQERFDLILAGHSHGGQFRIPLLGAVVLPFGVDEYDLGLFHTSKGPLYVNPGIGWFPVPIRFNCRPEITCFEI